MASHANAAYGGSTYRLLSNHDGLGIAELGPVLLLRWRGAVTPETFDRQWEALEAIARRYPGAAGLVTVIEHQAPPPDPKMRKATTEMVAALEGRLRCIACVVEGAGFKAAGVRSVLSGMALLRKVKVPLKFTATVDEASEWVAIHPLGIAPDEIRSGHAQLKESMTLP